MTTQRNDPLGTGPGQTMTQQSSYTPVEDEHPGHEATESEDTGVTDKARDAASRVQEKAQELMPKAQEQADAGVEKAAEGLQGAADKIREHAATSDGIHAQASTKVADTMERTAGYLRENDTQAIMDDLESYVKEHPMQALAGAIIGGFVVGRMLR